ncbi:MAG: FAD-dependent oxidoreductase [Gammaproteobacteria bacterium]
MKIVVVGAGYSGIACLARLSAAAPAAERHLVSPRPWHLHRTRLHEAVRRPLSELREPLPGLARRWDFVNHRGRVQVTDDNLAQWRREGCLEVGRRKLGFDYLVLATGLPGPRPPGRSRHTLGLDEVATGPGRNRLRRMAAADGPPLWIVGAGASGLQFAFELAHAGAGPLAVVDAADALLPGESPSLVRYVKDRLEEAGIRLWLGHFYRGFVRGRVQLEAAADGAVRMEPGRGVLLCTGPASRRLRAARDGRLLLDDQCCERIFAAGDCASWEGEGFDAATAQAAIRKGRRAAENVGASARGRSLEAYDARQLGFFLSLGPEDGVGWALSDAALIKGWPAVAAREAIESRWELLLSGVDTFSAF